MEAAILVVRKSYQIDDGRTRLEPVATPDGRPL
jgi:hypothetical protein